MPILSAAFPFAYPAGEAAGAPRARPNVIVFQTDDQTVESLKVMTKTRQLLGSAGTTFDNSFVSLSLTAPSRSTFLTGQYAHNHRVFSNKLPTGGYGKLNNANTLAVWLRRAGYRTAGPGDPGGGPPASAGGEHRPGTTIVAITGVRPGRLMDGVSLLPLARSPRAGAGRALLLEGPVRRSTRVTVSFAGVRTARYKYVEYATGEKELYDLARDRFELGNLAASRAHASIRSRLAARLRALRQCRGPSCRAVRAR